MESRRVSYCILAADAPNLGLMGSEDRMVDGVLRHSHQAATYRLVFHSSSHTQQYVPANRVFS